MEKQRKYKLFVVIALVVAICGMTLGFAAFSKVLTINSSATITPNEEDFNIVGSGSANDHTITTVVPKVSGGATASDGIIVNNVGASTMSAAVNFTAPGQSATYSFYIHNIGEYDAFLKKLEFLPADGETVNKVCIADVGTNETLVAQACESIEIAVIAGIGGQELTFYETTEFPQNISMLKSEYGTGKLIITYNEDGVRADGSFTVKIGGISIYYSTAN